MSEFQILYSLESILYYFSLNVVFMHFFLKILHVCGMFRSSVIWICTVCICHSDIIFIRRAPLCKIHLKEFSVLIFFETMVNVLKFQTFYFIHFYSDIIFIRTPLCKIHLKEFSVLIFFETMVNVLKFQTFYFIYFWPKLCPLCNWFLNYSAERQTG